MDIRQLLFTNRSFTPIPFLIVVFLFAKPTLVTLAVGFFIALIGESLRLWGVSIAGSETRTRGPVGGTYLITTGPFAYVRNPLYLGNTIIYMGIAVMSNALFPWLVFAGAAFFFLQYYLIVTLEEEHLAKKFGKEFEDYIDNVSRFLPRLKPYRGISQSNPPLDVKKGLLSEKRTLQAFGLLLFALIVRSYL